MDLMLGGGNGARAFHRQIQKHGRSELYKLSKHYFFSHDPTMTISSLHIRPTQTVDKMVIGPGSVIKALMGKTDTLRKMLLNLIPSRNSFEDKFARI